ncbi:MAG: FRG domain-containing protein [Oscillospiraceae bacterium]
MQCIADYVEKIRNEIAILQAQHDKYFDTKLLFAYRGESRDYGATQLMPSLFRDSKQVHKEHHLFELLCDYNIVSSEASNVEKAIEAQHYAAISRMLDISFNALVALYFACSDIERSGYLFVFAFPEHYSPHSKYVEDFYTNMLSKKHIPYSRNFKVFSHSFSNDRIKAQKGGFIFFPGTDFIPINNCYYRKISIQEQDKAILLKDLEMLFLINEASIFPEKEKIAKVVKSKFELHDYSDKVVSIDDEINTYFGRINYELKLCNAYMATSHKKETLRLLRKERADLRNYVRFLSINNLSDEKRIELLKRIDRGFQILEIRYKEG